MKLHNEIFYITRGPIKLLTQFQYIRKHAWRDITVIELTSTNSIRMEGKPNTRFFARSRMLPRSIQTAYCLINSWQSGPLIGDDYTLQVALPSALPLESGGNARRRRRRWRRDKRSNVLFFGWPETLPYTNEAKLRVRRYPDLLGSLADGHNLSGLVAELAARGVGVNL